MNLNVKRKQNIKLNNNSEYWLKKKKRKKNQFVLKGVIKKQEKSVWEKKPLNRINQIKKRMRLKQAAAVL